MRSSASILAFVALASCGPPSSRSSEIVTEDEPPAPREVHLDALPEGECGAFASGGRSEPLPLLAGRLRVRAPAGAEDSPRPHDIMSAPPAAALESRLFLESEAGERFVVFAVELFRRSTEDLLAAAREDAGEGYSVSAIEVAPPLRAVVAVPDELDLSDEAVDVALAYTVTEDDLVQRVAFYVTPDAARTGGCRRLGVELARTLVAGGRRVPVEAGPRVLGGTLGIDLPADHRLVVQEGPDFTVYRVYPVLPLGGGRGQLGMYMGNHPSFSPPADSVRTPGRVLGQAMAWHDSTSEGAHAREALVAVGSGSYVHVFMVADDREVLDALTQIASSLRHGVRPPPLAACPAEARMPAVETDAEVLGLEPVQTLLGAPAFSIHRSGWDVERVETTAAFLELAAHARSREAFLHLAVHGTTAGKLYGLAGLYLYDRARFEEVVCAVRATLEPTVRVRGSCGTEERPVPEMVEAPDGIRGQAHWSPEQWRMALHTGRADLRGGGLAWRLALGPAGQRQREEHEWAVSGDGYTPAFREGDRLAETLPPLAPARDRRARMSITDYGGVCRTRRDGRVACWGSTPLSERRGPALLPDSVRWPADVAVDLGLGCVLDARGQRACFALLEPALAARAEACPDAAAPTEPVLRRFDDGPWRALDVGRHVCGIRTDGSLRCFASSTRYLPGWAELDGEGVGASYAVPIEGDVQGVAPGEGFGAYAWTADGTIWQWDRGEAPHTIGRVEGLVDVTAGNDSDVVFARTADGRVLVQGAPHERDGTLAWWSSYRAREERSWEEVEALRGAEVTVGAHHGCARMPDARVRCWGSQPAAFATDDARARRYDLPPEDVPALNGASALILREGITCGVMRGGELRCIGARLEGITNGAAEEGARGPITVRPDRIAAGIR